MRKTASKPLPVSSARALKPRVPRTPRWSRPPRDASKRYTVAFFASALAFLPGLWPALGLGSLTSLFYAAVVISAWYGGLGPGLVAALVSALGQGVLVLSPEWNLAALGPADYVRGAVFLLVAFLTGTLTEWLRSERANAEATAVSAIATSGALELEKLRSEAILRSVSDGITVQDASGRIVYANDGAARMLGYGDGSALEGEPADEVYARLAPIDEDERTVALGQMPGPRALGGEQAPEKLICYQPPGSESPLWTLVRARPIHDRDGRVVLAVSAMHDLTERIRYERALESNARDLHQLTARLEVMVEQLRVEREGLFAARADAEEALDRVVTLQRVTAALSEARTPDEVGEVVLERGMEALGARTGLLLAFGGGDEAIEVVRAAGVPLHRLEEWVRRNPVDLSQLRMALRRDEMAFSEPSDVPPDSAPTAEALRRALGTEAVVTIPVTARDRPLGVLAFGMPSLGPVDPRDRDLLIALGRQCAQALDRALLFADERQARGEAEHASRAKSQFLALMSHELRTPLNAILGYEELLETEVSGPVSGVQKHHLGRIRESTRHLLSLIEQILSLSKVQAGKDDVQLEELDAASLTREAAAIIEPHLKRKGIELQLDLPEESVDLRTDSRKLRQILLNVLSNAVKFTDQGTVRVALTRGDGWLYVTVRDTGRGIDERDREHIFEPFVQVRIDGAPPTGTGLGLAVARELARHMGGDITLESHPGEGSAFTIRVPHVLPELHAVEDRPRASVTTSLS